MSSFIVNSVMFYNIRHNYVSCTRKKMRCYYIKEIAAKQRVCESATSQPDSRQVSKIASEQENAKRQHWGRMPELCAKKQAPVSVSFTSFVFPQIMTLFLLCLLFYYVCISVYFSTAKSVFLAFAFPQQQINKVSSVKTELSV